MCTKFILKLSVLLFVFAGCANGGTDGNSASSASNAYSVETLDTVTAGENAGNEIIGKGTLQHYIGSGVSNTCMPLGNSFASAQDARFPDIVLDFSNSVWTISSPSPSLTNLNVISADSVGINFFSFNNTHMGYSVSVKKCSDFNYWYYPISGNDYYVLSFQ